MPDAFDPYHEWLGIPPHQQPPDHYRLLGATCFEKNLDTIRHAAGRRLAHLRSLQQGEHGDQARKLLREVADARACLLAPQEKAAYDRRLREILEAGKPALTRTRTAAAPQPPPPPGGKHSGKTPTEVYDLGRFGEYELLEKLGEGGMGVVYSAMHTKLRRRVALKVLPRDRLGDDRAVARFEREMAAVGAVEHANVVRAYDAREIEGTHLLVMELVEGLDLSDLVSRGGPLPVADACETVRQAALGLQAAHEHGLVHRDIKPSNLMLSRTGQVKLLDLGLARFQLEGSPDDELTTGHHAFGTVAYMAPEQAADTHTVDIRADIYSLGGTLYKLLSGHPPFSGPKFRSNVDVLLAHANAPVPSIQRVRPDVPDELAGIVQRMLAKRPEERFATPAEVADAIGPLSADSDLAALVAQCEGRPAAAPDQALAGTQEPESSTSSALTRLFDRIKGDAADSPIAAPSSVSARRKRKPLVIASGVAAVALVAAVGAWVVFSNGWSPSDSTRPDEVGAAPTSAPVSVEAPSTLDASGTRLVIRWPEADRVDAKLEIDGQEFDLSDTSVESTAEEITLALRAGQHTLWIGRRGFQPYTQQLALADGQSLEVAPEWSESFAGPDMVEPAPDEPVVVEPPPEDPRDEEARQRLAEYEATETRWREATGPAEALVDAWNFAGGLAALQSVEFDDEPLASRLVRRRDELRRLVEFKSRIIESINAADPPLKTLPLEIPGRNSDVTGADENAIRAKPSVGETETHAWSELRGETVSKLMQLVVSRENGDDLTTAGLLALVADAPQLGRRLFDSAGALGADVAPYEATLARAAFAQANSLLKEGKYSEADSLLSTIDDRYSAIPWFVSAKPSIDAARDAAKTGILRNEEAEKLYAEAVEVFGKRKELWDLRDLVEKLKSEYADTNAVTERRRPSLLEMENAVADVPKAITVRLDGTADFTSIQAAIDAAPSQSLIEIGDDGPYHEKVLIPKDKFELRLRGKKGCWPVITSADLPVGPHPVVTVEGADAFLERLVLLHYRSSSGSVEPCVLVRAGGVRLRWAIIDRANQRTGIATADYQSKFDCEECLLTVGAVASAPAVFRNCVLVGGLKVDPSGCKVQFCTILLTITAGNGSGVRPLDSILGAVSTQYPFYIENCALLAGDVPERSPGCFKADPMFVDPENLDYRLKPGSPCIGRASDGGDIGCRYTPEMIELCEKARDLRRAGILKF